MRESIKKVGRVLGGAAILTLLNGFSIGLVRPDVAVAAARMTGDILGWALALLCAGGGVAVAAMNSLDKWFRARRRTRATPGIVIGRSLESDVGDTSTVYRAVVHVRYEVRGKELELDWTPSSMAANIPWLVEFFLERKYPGGKELTVYYEWQDPQNAWVGRAWSAPLLSVPLVTVLLGGILAGAYVTGSFLRGATDGFLTAQWTNAKALAGEVSQRIEQPPPAEASTSSSVTLTPEEALRLALRSNIGASSRGASKDHDLCSCIAETKTRDERVQLTLAIGEGEEKRRAGRFETRYRLHVGQAPALSLPAMPAGAPGPHVDSRVVEMAMACTPDAAIIVQGDWATAWSLVEPEVVWNTRLERSLNLLSGRAPDTGFSLICRELPVKKGMLSIPVGRAKSLQLRASDGSARGAGAGN